MLTSGASWVICGVKVPLAASKLNTPGRVSSHLSPSCAPPAFPSAAKTGRIKDAFLESRHWEWFADKEAPVITERSGADNWLEQLINAVA